MAHCVDSTRRIRGADVDMLRRYVFYSRLIVAVRNIVNARLQQVRLVTTFTIQLRFDARWTRETNSARLTAYQRSLSSK